MKKTLFAAILFAIGMTTSCQKTESTDMVNGGESIVTISALFPSEMQQTRVVGDGTTVNRCIMGIYLDGALYGEQQVAAVEGLKATFEARLVAGKEYTLAFWADCANGTGADNFSDKHYVTADLENVTFADTDAYLGNDEERDAFFGTATVTADKSQAVNVELRRPFGQLNVKTLDAAEVKAASPALVPTKASIAFEKVYTGINLLTGELVGETVAVNYSAAADVVDSETGELTFDYIFAPKGTEQYLVNFTMSFLDDAGTEVASAYEFSNIPVQRNYRTNVSGNLLTKKADINVEVKPEFDGDVDKNVEVVSTIDELNSVLEGLEAKEYTVTDTITGTDNTVVIPEGMEGDDLVLHFSNVEEGASINVVTENGEYAGNVTIVIDEGSGDVTVDAPNSDVTLSGDYGTVTSSADPLTVDEGASVDELNVESGNVNINGRVGRIARTAGNNDGKTVVTVNENGELTEEPTDENIFVLSFPIFSGGGSGTPEDPYLLSTADDMLKIGELYTNGLYDYIYSAVLKLTGDIDMSATPVKNLGVMGFLLDGDGHKLTVNLTSESSLGAGSNVGLFAGFNGKGNSYIYEATTDEERNSEYAYELDGKTYVIYGGCIRDLVIDGTVYSNADGAVSPLGCGQNTGYIINVTNYADVTAEGDAYFVAGIVSGTRGTGLVIDCKNYGTIKGTYIVGGITAQLYGGSSCNGTYPDIMAPYSASVKNCENHGEIICSGRDVGGIVGQTHGYGGGRCISNCVNTANITGGTNVGGMIGRHTTTGGALMIENCTNSGTITATDEGGLWGNLGVLQGTMMEGSQTE